MPVTARGALCQVYFQRRVSMSLAGPYVRLGSWLWKRMPPSWVSSRPMKAYGSHLHRLVQRRTVRRQFVGTFFLRNRPELELLIRLLDKKTPGSTVDLLVLACSKGAEVYSISYAIRCLRPDLNLNLRALDIDRDVLEFAKGGVYALTKSAAAGAAGAAPGRDVALNTFREQDISIVERMTPEEMQAIFDREGDQVKVKPQFRSGVTWHLGDASDPDLTNILGLQDIVIANRFLCHMPPAEAEKCLRGLGRQVKPGGYLFVSGVDLDVRTKVCRELGWQPVTDLIREIHEGDPSLRRDWPLEYWGLEPFDQDRADWKMRYVSVFQPNGSV